MNETNKINTVLIIPYFGKIPDYFNLWLKSAEKNPDFTFFIYTDLDFKVREDSNVKIKYTTFDDLKDRIKNLFGKKSKIKSPYKLCDYKPAYGLIFEDDIKEFDFWGFCDIDIILGNLNHFITEDIFENYDKIFFHGHFSLFRNCEKMNKLFLKKYKNVCDYEYAFTTNYICHFDESGTVTYASKIEKNINMFFEWTFYDVPCMVYEFVTISDNNERVLEWNNGLLNIFEKDGKIKEIMYVHLQKRKMHGWNMIPDDSNRFLILRTKFIDNIEGDNPLNFLVNKNSEEKKKFLKVYKSMRRKQIFDNVLSGALKSRLKRFKTI